MDRNLEIVRFLNVKISITLRCSPFESLEGEEGAGVCFRLPSHFDSFYCNRKVSPHLLPFPFSRTEVRHYLFFTKQSDINVAVIQPRPQNRGALWQQPWHDKDPSHPKAISTEPNCIAALYRYWSLFYWKIPQHLIWKSMYRCLHRYQYLGDEVLCFVNIWVRALYKVCPLETGSVMSHVHRYACVFS